MLGTAWHCLALAWGFLVLARYRWELARDSRLELIGTCWELRDIRLDLHGIRMALLGTRPGLLGIRAELIGVAW